MGILACGLVAAVGAFTTGCKKAGEARPTAPACPTCVTVDETGFAPSKLEVPSGPTGETRDVTFTRVVEDTCATEVVFPELGLKQALPYGKPTVVKIPASPARTLTFQCGMGMYKSALVVH